MPTWPGSALLDLKHLHLGDGQAQALAASPHLSGLWRLDLEDYQQKQWWEETKLGR